VETACNLTESSKEGYGSRRAVSQLMTMMMMMMTTTTVTIMIYVMNLYCILVMWHENKYILSFSFFGATAPISALAYLHETLRFTSVF
jgi:hypothetical protein